MLGNLYLESGTVGIPSGGGGCASHVPPAALQGGDERQKVKASRAFVQHFRHNFQKCPKTISGRAKTGPRGTQDRSRQIQDRFKTGQDRPRQAQGRSRQAKTGPRQDQDRSKTDQNRPKTTQNRPKTGPRQAKTSQDRPQEVI